MVDYCNYKMSGSEEEHELHVQTGMSKAELRRSNKPIMEKRRRARINQCLDELKFLILEAMKKDPSRHSKLEKADILEMTVKHLQAVQRQQLNSAVATDPAVLTKFRSGFSECATETSRYVSHLENVDPVVKQRLVSHLNNCVSNLQQMAPFYSHYVPYMPERLYPEVKVGFQNDFQNGDENNNASARIQIPNGVQLIPSRLPTGELALLLSQSATISANFPFFPTPSESISKNNQSSAFIAMPRPQSPLLSPSSSTSSFGEENQQPEQLSQVHSPVHHNRRLKNHGRNSTTSETLNSSPETQKPQISSTSDSKSPVPILIESKADSSVISRKDIHCCESLNWNGQTTQSLRQPLSVITDKAYNRNNFLSPRKESLKRCSSDGFLAISDKKPKICVDSIKSTIKSFNTNLWSAEDQGTSNKHFLENTTLPVNKESNYSIKLSDAGPSGSNSDMWRPW